MTTKHSFCRNCAANCGMVFEVVDNRIAHHKADKGNPFSEGFMCIKGDFAVDLHNGVEERLTHSLRREADGGFSPVENGALMDELGERLAAIIAEHGPRSVAVFYGTCAYQKSLTIPMAKEFMAQLGSPNLFSTMTIDQSAHWVTDGRMGLFATGIPRIEDLDTLVLIGTNPVISHGSVFMSLPNNNQVAHLKAFRARGGKLVVVDPRRSETARSADLHVQALPGRDGAIAAGLIRLLLERGWHDKAFCDRFVTGLDALERAVAPFTPDRVAQLAGVNEGELESFAELLRAPRRVSIGFGTGMTMSPHPNTTAHLVRALNAICGGYLRAGDTLRNPGVLMDKPSVEGVYPPSRSWESGPQLRTGHGRLYGEFPSSRLPTEILTPGEGQIRALIVVGGNPIAAFGQSDLIREALGALETLVVIDPRMTDTARLADYVVAPPLQFEVHDFSSFADVISPDPFLQYSPPVIAPPEGTIEEWRFFNGLANRLGVTLTVKPFAFSSDAASAPEGLAIDPARDWDTRELLDWNLKGAGLSCATLAAHPHGMAIDKPPVPIRAAPADDGARLDLCPPDVEAEVALLTDAPVAAPGGYLLITRRLTETMNSAYRRAPRVLERLPNNALFMHPDDLAAEGIAAGGAVRVANERGAIRAHAKSDASLRRGVVAMTHCWGATEKDAEADGNVNRLVTFDADRVAAIDAMPQHSSLAVTVARAEA